MAVSGWYPDPGGARGQFRYWDGKSWSVETCADPASPPPGSDRRKTPWAVLVGIVAVVVVLAILAAVVLPGLWPSNNAATDWPSTTTSAWDESEVPTPSASPSTPTPTPSPSQPMSVPATTRAPSASTTAVQIQACPYSAPFARTSSNIPGKLVGGGLSVSTVPSWQSGGFTPGFTTDITSVTYFVQATWFNQVAVGALEKRLGFTSVQESASAVLQCLASSSYYNNIASSTTLASEATTVSGHTAWRIQAEVLVTGYGNIAGDRIDIVVVDTGLSDELGVYIDSATIGRSDIAKLVDTAAATLQVA